jgi:hypothetical protein
MSQKPRSILSVLLAGLLSIMITLLLLYTPRPTRGSAYDLFVQNSSVTVANTTTETSIIGTGIGSTSINLNSLLASDSIRVVALGHISSAVVPGTLRLRVKIGGITVADSGAQAMPVSLSTGGIYIYSLTACRSIGASGSLFTQGYSLVIPNSIVTQAVWPMTNTSPQTIDTTSAKVVDVTAQFGTASANNSLTITHLQINKSP